MKTKNLMLFTYDFPHKKTQDFLFRLIVEGYNIKYCIAAPWKKLNIKPSVVRVDQRHEGLIHPKEICKYFSVKYKVADHDSKETVNFIKRNPVDLCIVSGARILSKEVIKTCGDKVLNIHPGLLPYIRGLDTFLWSIYYKKPLGITAHLITPKIDSGFLVYKKRLPVFTDDTPFDVSLRLLESQTDILVNALQILEKKELKDLDDLSRYKNLYNSKMDEKLEKKALVQFENWIKLFAK